MRRKRQERHGGAGQGNDRWMISYSDMLTLLLSVFIMLFASASVDKGKLQKEAAGLLEAFTGKPPSLVPLPSTPTSAFHALPKPIPAPIMAMHAQLAEPAHRHVARGPGGKKLAPLPVARPAAAPAPEVLPLAEQKRLRPAVLAMAKLRAELASLLAPDIARQKIAIINLPLAIRIRLNAEILFDTGQARLTPEALKVLGPVGDVLAHVPEGYLISIQGYTDDRPIRTARFASNWELSTARAVSVVKLFHARGVPGEALSAEGFSKYQPIASNTTEAGRTKNRRVEILITAPKPVRSVRAG